MLTFDQFITFCYQLNMTDIKQLKAFIAVAEELNFHRAAERLGTVQPALSRMVRNLELDMKVTLLQRTTRHVELTESGKVFLDEARNLIEQLASAVRNTQNTAMGISGRLTLAYMDFAVHQILPDMLGAVAKTSPDIRIELVYMSTSRQRSALLDGALDIGIIIGEMTSPNVDTLRLADLPLMIGVSKKSPLAAMKKLALADILNEPVLIGNAAEWSAFRDVIFALYAQAGVMPNIVQEASSAAALLGLVAKGLGLTFYAGAPKLYQSPGIAFVPLAPKCTLPVTLAWRKGPKLQLARHVLKLAELI